MREIEGENAVESTENDEEDGEDEEVDEEDDEMQDDEESTIDDSEEDPDITESEAEPESDPLPPVLDITSSSSSSASQTASALAPRSPLSAITNTPSSSAVASFFSLPLAALPLAGPTSNCHDPVQDTSAKTSQTQLPSGSALGSDLGTTPQPPLSRSTSSSSPTKHTSALGLVLATQHTAVLPLSRLHPSDLSQHSLSLLSRLSIQTLLVHACYLLPVSRIPQATII
ncbi:hypothetical protein CF319_g6020 [Tilletia indica]|nr:hypothetical protein CF319_g6020 [Tilletia indica]